jgi:hypothetical protein
MKDDGNKPTTTDAGIPVPSDERDGSSPPNRLPSSQASPARCALIGKVEGAPDEAMRPS